MRFLVKVPLLLLGLSFVGAGAYFLMSTYASGVAVQGNHGNVGLVRPLPMSSHVTAKGEETSNKTVTDQKSHEYPKTIPSPQVKIQSTLVQNKPVIVRGTHFVDNSDKNVEKSPKALKWQDANLNWLTTQKKPSTFDPSDTSYKRNDGIEVAFTKLDHRRLFKNYLAASAELRKPTIKSEAQEPLLVPVMAQVNNQRGGKEDEGKVPEIITLAEDTVTEQVAKSEELLQREEAMPSMMAPEMLAVSQRQINPMISSAYSSQEAGEAKKEVPPSAQLGRAVQRKIPSPSSLPPSPQKTTTGHASDRVDKGPRSGNLSISVAETVVSAQHFSFKAGLGEDVRNISVKPDYSEEELWGDAGTGRVSIQKTLRSSMGILGGVLSSHGMVTTRVDFIFEPGVTRQMSIPVFSQEDLEELLGKKGFSRGGGLLFIELDGSTESVNIEAQYEGVVYLDVGFRQVDPSRDYRYMLFAGVTPGSTMLEYIRNGYENLKKIILVEEGTVYYEPNEYFEVGGDIVQIDQRNVLGSYQSGLGGDGRVEHKQFNSFEKISQVGPNQYDLTVNVIPSGTRKYVEFNHLSTPDNPSPIYLGRWDVKKVVLPSEDYIAYTLGAIGLEDFSESEMCLVQVNFGGRVDELFIEGRDGQSHVPIDVDRVYIDEDGYVSETLSVLSVHGIFFTYGAGVFSLAVKYEDGKEDYLNTYCSASAYLIEQL